MNKKIEIEIPNGYDLKQVERGKWELVEKEMADYLSEKDMRILLKLYRKWEYKKECLFEEYAQRVNNFYFNPLEINTIAKFVEQHGSSVYGGPWEKDIAAYDKIVKCIQSEITKNSSK